MNAIIIVQYECPHLLSKQLPLVAKYLPGVHVHVYDNSRSSFNAFNNQYLCQKYAARYMQTFNGEGDFSLNHASTLNIAYDALRNKYSKIMLLDHDMFPFADSMQLFDHDKAFIGYPQVVNGTHYLHPGMMVIDTTIGSLDFTPCDGLDTGGRLAELMTIDNTMHVDYVGGFALGYEIIARSFFHMVKGSNWNRSEGHDERMLQLWDELDKLIT